MSSATVAARALVVRSWALHVPGAGDADVEGIGLDDVMCTADDAGVVLGRKGLLFKEPATRLALCAVHRAFGFAPGKPTLPVAGPARTAVVVSSNLGNLRTVCDIAERVRETSYRDVSPLEAPNASSNIVASAIAIRFGFTGANITVCNGATSGIDAMRVAARLMRAGRAARVVVVGVEPADDVAASLAVARDPRSFPGVPPALLREAAACVVLEAVDVAQPGDIVVRDGGVIAPGVSTTPVFVGAPGALAFVPYGARPHQHREVAPCEVIDLTERLGETYGAEGVLQVAAAATRLRRGRTSATAVAACGDGVDGHAWVTLDKNAAALCG